MNTAGQPALTGYDALGTLIADALEAEAPAQVRMPPPPVPPTRWQRWRARRRAAVAAMDLGYRLSPATYRYLRESREGGKC